MAKRRSLRVLLIASGLLVALHCSTEPSPSPSTEVPPPLPSLTTDTSQVCLTIGPEGGTLTHGARARLVIPPGALDEASSICLTGVAAPAGEALGGVALGQGFDASPAGQTFHRAVDLFVPGHDLAIDEVTGGLTNGQRVLMVFFSDELGQGARRVEHEAAAAHQLGFIQGHESLPQPSMIYRE